VERIKSDLEVDEKQIKDEIDMYEKINEKINKKLSSKENLEELKLEIDILKNS
jgi:hypothetical protein